MLHHEDPKLLPLYVFPPLDQLDQIRVLRLRPCKERIELYLDHIKLSSRGYQALSYVWGSEEKSHYAVVYGIDGNAIGRLPLTANLHSALQDLRDSTEVQGKCFWIDQLCIDQGAKEKNDQVALMGEIFRNADRVITYSGPAENEEVEIAGGELISRLYLHFSEDYPAIFAMESATALIDGRLKLPIRALPENLENWEEDDQIPDEWRWLCSVAFGSWTSRLWIVQEQILNEHDPVVLRGQRLLSWQHVTMMSVLFMLDFLPPKFTDYCFQFFRDNFKDSAMTPIMVSQSVYEMMRRRRTIKEHGYSGLRLQTVLKNFGFYQDLKCRDPRDRIFAILAISRDSTKLGVRPFYSDVDSSRPFLDLSQRILEDSDDLALLAVACRWSPGVTAMHHPSWALNAPLKSPIPDNLPFHLFTPHPRKKFAKECVFHRNGTAFIMGRILDQISVPAHPLHLSTAIFLSDPVPSSMGSLIAIMSSCSKVLRHWGLPFELEKTASFCRAYMSGSATWPSTLTSERLVFRFWCHYRYLYKKAAALATRMNVPFEQWATFRADIEQMAEFFSSWAYPGFTFTPLPGSEYDEFVEASSAQTSIIIEGRSLSVTGSGHPCNAMNEVRQGDVVAALQGADRLFVLRPIEKQYRLIGDAYVDGFMAGEAYKGLEADEVDYEIEII